MFATLTTLISSTNLKVGNHFISTSKYEEYSIPSKENTTYVFISYDNFIPTLKIYNKSENISVPGTKNSFFQYTLFEIPNISVQNVIAGYNAFNESTYTLRENSVAILLYSQPVTCKITTQNGNHTVAGSPEELIEGQISESESYFFGSELIVIKSAYDKNATITFKDTNIPTNAGYNVSEKDILLNGGTQSSFDNLSNFTASHVGLYNLSSNNDIAVTTSPRYYIHCIRGSLTNNEQSTIQPSDGKVTFLVVKGTLENTNIINTNSGSKYLWSTSENEVKNSANKTLFVSDAPIRLSFTKTEGVNVNLSVSLAESENFQTINTNIISVYGQAISLQVNGSGVLYISQITGLTTLTASSTQDNMFNKTDDDVIFLQTGSVTSKITRNTMFVVPKDCVTYFYKNDEFIGQSTTQINISKNGENFTLNYITVNTTNLITVENIPNVLIKGTKILFVSGISKSSVRSLHDTENNEKSLKVYSDENAQISIIPSGNVLSNHKITNALAVYIQVQEETLIGFYEQSGYTGTISISGVNENNKYTNPIVITSSHYGKAESEDTYSIFPKTGQKNVLLKGQGENYDLSVIEKTQQITVKKGDSYFIATVDPNVDHISAIINPKQYTRKTVMPGNCVVFIASSKPVKFNDVNGLKRSFQFGQNSAVLTGQLSSETHIDFTGESVENINEVIVNIKGVNPSVENYYPKWDATSTFNGKILSPGRYNIQLTSSIQTVTFESSSMAFFVPKSINDAITIDVINPVLNSKNVKKFNIFSKKLLGYYFSSSFQVELSGSSTIEIYVYKLSTQPNMDLVTFNRGGDKLESKGIGFVGFSNYSLCVITNADGLSLNQYNNKDLSSTFTSDPFIIQKKGTVKYRLISEKQDADSLFTIPSNEDGTEIQISSSEANIEKGSLITNDGLTPGAKAGIAVAIILFIIIDVAIILLVCYCRKHEPKVQYNFEEEELLEGDAEVELMDENEQGEDLQNMDEHQE